MRLRTKSICEYAGLVTWVKTATEKKKKKKHSCHHFCLHLGVEKNCFPKFTLCSAFAEMWACIHLHLLALVFLNCNADLFINTLDTTVWNVQAMPILFQLKLFAPCFSSVSFFFNVKYSLATEHLYAYHWPLHGTPSRRKEQVCFNPLTGGVFWKCTTIIRFSAVAKKSTCIAAKCNKRKKWNLKSWSSVAVVLLRCKEKKNVGTFCCKITRQASPHTKEFRVAESLFQSLREIFRLVFFKWEG